MEESLIVIEIIFKIHLVPLLHLCKPLRKCCAGFLFETFLWGFINIDYYRKIDGILKQTAVEAAEIYISQSLQSIKRGDFANCFSPCLFSI